MNLCGLEGRTSAGRGRRNLDVVEETVEQRGRGVADVAAELAFDGRRHRLQREAVDVACRVTRNTSTAQLALNDRR